MSPSRLLRQTDDEPGEAGRPRDPELDRRILESTLALLREGGPEVVTIEAVSAASRVAKTSIYRRYKNSDELRDSALDALVAEIPPPPSGSLGRQLTSMLTSFQEGLEHGVGLPAVSALLKDPDSSFARAMRAHVIEPRYKAMIEVVAAALAEGRLRESLEPTAVVNALAGTYFTQLMVTGSVRSDWITTALALLDLEG